MVTDNDDGSDYIRVRGRNLIRPSTKIDLQDDYFRSTSRYAKEFTLLTRRAIETTKRRNSRSKRKKDVVHGSESFLNGGPIDKATVSSEFRRLVVRRFVVSSFCDRDKRTK